MLLFVRYEPFRLNSATKLFRFTRVWYKWSLDKLNSFKTLEQQTILSLVNINTHSIQNQTHSSYH